MVRRFPAATHTPALAAARDVYPDDDTRVTRGDGRGAQGLRHRLSSGRLWPRFQWYSISVTP
ncbi:hypothetical protein ACP4OV_022704 [Aristida adscensionis]